MTPEQKSEFLIRSTHEAGHAVAAHVLGFRIKVLNIIGDQEFAGSSCVENPVGDGQLNWNDAIHRKIIEDYHVVVAAGLPASLLGIRAADRDMAERRAAFDAKVLDDNAKQMFPEPELQESYKIEIRAKAQDLVTIPSHRAAIVSLAMNSYPSTGAIEPDNAHKIIAAAISSHSPSADRT